MNSTLFLILILILSTVLDTSAQEEWKLEKEEDGIKVFTKKEAGSDFKSFKAEMEVNCTIEEIVNVLKDVESYKKWTSDSKEAKLLEMKGNDQYHYVETSLPWPFSNRDMVYYLKYKKINNKQIKVNITGLPEYIEPKDGIVRMKKAEGYWLLTSIDSGRSSIIQQMHVEPGGSVPGWLANSGVVDAPFSTFTSLKDLLEN